MGRDIGAAVWGYLEQASPTDRLFQRTYIARTADLIRDWSNAEAVEAAASQKLVAVGLPTGFAAAEGGTGDDTIYPAWLRSYLPELKIRLDAAPRKASSENDRMHFGEMAAGVSALIKSLN